MRISIKAPAKINWFLSILDKRADGYHEIISAMQCVDLFDVLSFDESEDIRLISELDIPPDENLVYKAAVLLKNFSSIEAGARITLHKNIPLAAGLGGGSSDAAAALIGLDRLWKLNLPAETLMSLASGIGSDVPFFLSGKLSLVRGRGELVTDLKTETSAVVLLVKPDIPVSTAWAYNSFQTRLTKKTVDIKLFCQALRNGNYDYLRNSAFNDLEDVVFRKYPVIGEIKNALLQNGALFSLMSGSGSAVFGIFQTTEEAVSASGHLKGIWCKVVNTLDCFEGLENENGS
jgi:4-diphosphocytidyl-2-C-methyl-D-erythritol kinase